VVDRYGIGRADQPPRVSPVEVTQAHLDRIAALNPRLNAYITVCADEALAAAREAERGIRRGEGLGPLHGVPFGAKDQFLTRGIRTTAGSSILRDYVPEEDATAVARLKRAGAILLGKHNMTEFAMGEGDYYKYGEPKNPGTWSDSPAVRAAYGRAVAAGCARWRWGGHGRFRRCPAAHCGVIGLRLLGLVSRHGFCR